MSAHGHGDHAGDNKTVALVISVLALLLAIAELFAQKAQTSTLQSNIEASNLWAFYQAKTIRKAVAETAADEMEAMLPGVAADPQRKSMSERIARFRTTAQRMDSEPETKEGRKELMKRAQEAEALRDKAGVKHYRFELASGAFQIAIVVASAAIITGINAMLWGSGGLAAIGLLFLLRGFIA